MICNNSSTNNRWFYFRNIITVRDDENRSHVRFGCRMLCDIRIRYTNVMVYVLHVQHYTGRTNVGSQCKIMDLVMRKIKRVGGRILRYISKNLVRREGIFFLWIFYRPVKNALAKPSVIPLHYIYSKTI